MSQFRTPEWYQERFFGENFVGASLAKIAEDSSGSVERIANWLKNPRDFLVIRGPVGIGKTYICSAMSEFILKKFGHFRAYTDNDLFSSIRNHISEKRAGDYMVILREKIDDDFIIIDDLGSSGYTDWRADMLFDLIEERYSSGKPTVFTTNLIRQDFVRIYKDFQGERIADRLFDNVKNTILDLKDWPSKRQK